MIEIDELVRLRILENNVDLLKRVMEHGHASNDLIRMIFGWQMVPSLQVSTSPAVVVREPADSTAIAPPPPKPMTSKKHEMMKKVKELHLEGLNGKQIAEKTGLSEGTVSTYKKEMGLVGEASLTMINAPE